MLAFGPDDPDGFHSKLARGFEILERIVADVDGVARLDHQPLQCKLKAFRTGLPVLWASEAFGEYDKIKELGQTESIPLPALNGFQAVGKQRDQFGLASKLLQKWQNIRKRTQLWRVFAIRMHENLDVGFFRVDALVLQRQIERAVALAALESLDERVFDRDSVIFLSDSG